MANTKNHVNTPLTQETLQFHIYYDADKGTFEWNTGRFAVYGQTIDFTVNKNANTGQSTIIKKRKTLSAQDMNHLPIKPYEYKANHAGYNAISRKRYLNVMSGAEDEYVGYKHIKGVNEPQYERKRQVYERHYRVHSKEVLGGYDVRTYYLIDSENPYNPSITVLGKKYTAKALAYHYMGYGLIHYDQFTGKKYRIPCRDGNPLNLSWDNIKPDVRIASTKPDDIQPIPKEVISDIYFMKNCIVPDFGGYSVTVADRTVPANTFDDAVIAFDNLISLLNGKVTRPRQGVVRVERARGSYTFKRTKQS